MINNNSRKLQLTQSYMNSTVPVISEFVLFIGKIYPRFVEDLGVSGEVVGDVDCHSIELPDAVKLKLHS